MLDLAAMEPYSTAVSITSPIRWLNESLTLLRKVVNPSIPAEQRVDHSVAAVSRPEWLTAVGSREPNNAKAARGLVRGKLISEV
jgi:hypothetical protein